MTNVYGEYELIATLKTPEEVHQFMANEVMKIIKKEKAGFDKEETKVRKAVGKKKESTLKKANKKFTSKSKKVKPPVNHGIMLPMTSKSFFVINHKDLEEVTKQKYGIDYSFMGKEHCGYGTHHVFSANKDNFKNKIGVDNIREGITIVDTQSIFDALCADGVIIPGNYLVEVTW